ncbi:hypothetical protein [Pseudomonas chlororaphis]|uniref:Uncharacterized protein n=1 Tax=Pseudomonas chlororaphis TaxID=587753 RepID=A0A1Q8EPV9_9PSED|nr:hypothetical protein [Pseudomonas chlororaphis]OLF53828.1 hypothetical protein BTN82_15285 [Pseudomonas chlororaphis]
MNTEYMEAELTGVTTLAGSPKEVRKQLANTNEGQVVAVTVAHASERDLRALESTIASFALLVGSVTAQREQQTLETLVEALVPVAPPRPALLKEAAMIARARTAILQGADWPTAAQVAELAGFSPINPSAQPNKWKRDGLIFALNHHGVDYFPGYGLDPDTGFRPRKAMARILEVFAGSKDGWTLAGWFLTPNGFLGGKRPQDLMASAPEQVLEAARDEMEGVAHG